MSLHKQQKSLSLSSGLLFYIANNKVCDAAQDRGSGFQKQTKPRELNCYHAFLRA